MLVHDLKYGLRMLVKAPGFSTVAILSLALGIGANAAIFSLINAVLLRPIPVSDAASLVTVSTTDQRNPGNLQLSHLNFKDLRADNTVFSDMAAFTFAAVNWSTGGRSEVIPAQIVTANYFTVLGTQPMLGRIFRPEEETNAASVAVLSEGFWERSLGSDPQAVGRTITLNRVPYTIVGVAPKHFTATLLGGGPSVWLPMQRSLVPVPEWYETRRGLFLFSVARLKPGVTIDQARANLKTIFAQLESAFPEDNKGRSAAVVPLLEARLNPTGQGANVVVQISSLLMVVVGIVLLIACANIANLMLARASKRRREVAIRLALGASRGRLVRQLLTESLLLSTLGGAAGLLVAYWTFSALVGARLPLPIPIDDSLTVDPYVLLFTAALSLLTGIVFGLAPALQASKPDVVGVLKDEIAPGVAVARGFSAYLAPRQVLVVAQVALSLIALIAAGLFLRTLRHQQSTDPGFQTRGVLVMTFNLAREGYTPQRGQIFYDQVLDRVQALPGVRRAAIAQSPPFAGGLARSVYPEGADTTTRNRVLVQVNAVSVGYVDAIGIPIVRGREFTRSDTAQSPRVAVINETMARQFWPDQEAIGKRFRFFQDPEYTTVIGIAKNSKYNGVAEDPIPYIYEAETQRYPAAATLHVRTDGDAASLASAVRHAVGQIDPTVSLLNVRTLEEQVSQSLQPLETNVILLGVFGALALALASIGLYGVASYSVSQRTREIGIRMALGAESTSVMRLALGHGMTLVVAGLAIGLAIALGIAGLMQALVVGINPRDPLTFAVTPVVLGSVALLASYLPARRATRIDPLIALRTD
jgi:macrolide transport system ATP-binding/permease protein